MQADAFREFARTKLYYFRTSPTKTFIALDEDHDGLITPKDIAKFFLRFHIKASYLSTLEISGWFSKICKRDPQEGISMTDFCHFLYSNAEQEQYFGSVSGKLYASTVEMLQRALVMHQARLATDFYGLYKAITGGQGFLYEHQLRAFFEREYQYFFNDQEWTRVFKIIKYNNHVQYITIEELYDFLMGKIEEQPAKKVVEFEECYQNCFFEESDEADEQYSYEEISDNGSYKQYEEPQKQPLYYDKPGEKLKRTRPKTVQDRIDEQKRYQEIFEQYRAAAEEQLTERRVSHQNCIPEWPPREIDRSGLSHLDCQKPKRESQKRVKAPIKLASNSPQITSHQYEGYRSSGLEYSNGQIETAARDTLQLQPLPLNANSMTKFHSTSVKSTPDMILNLIADKIKQAGEPRAYFRRFDVQKTNRISYRIFSQYIQRHFGIVLSPDQCREFVQLLAPNAQYIDYYLFLRFYDAQYVVYYLRDTKRVPSQCKSHQKVQYFLTSYNVQDSLARKRSAQSQGTCNCETNENYALALGDYGLRAVYLRADDVKTASYPDNLKFDRQTRPEEPARVYEQQIALVGTRDGSYRDDRGEKAIDYMAQNMTVNYINQAVIHRDEDPKMNLTYSLVNETSQIMTYQERYEQNDFVAKCKQMMDARGDSLRKCLRECYPDKFDLSSGQLVWFFRNRIGCSFSPNVILQTFSMRDGDYVNKADILKRFQSCKTRKFAPAKKH